MGAAAARPGPARALAPPPSTPLSPPPLLPQVLASRVRTMMHTARTRSRRITITDGFNPSTRKMINRWVAGGGDSHQLLLDPPLN